MTLGAKKVQADVLPEVFGRRAAQVQLQTNRANGRVDSCRVPRIKRMVIHAASAIGGELGSCTYHEHAKRPTAL